MVKRRRNVGIASGVAAILLAGCGGAAQMPSLGMTQQTSAVQPLAKSGALFYVSDTVTSEVYVFTYPGGKLVQTLPNFRDPGGECVDAAGDVYVTNTGDASIVEYAHGATKPKATIEDGGYFPFGCAVDPKNGDLAVTNFSTSRSGPGNVVIYAKGKVKQRLTDQTITGMLLCGYDITGNLFVDGTTQGSTAAFAELLAGASKLENLTLNQNIESPGGVQWDGRYLAIGDEATNTIYRFAISNQSGYAKGTKAGSTQLDGGNTIVQFWIDRAALHTRGNVIGPNSGSGTVGIWKYPAGGQPTKTITGLYVPLGTVVSEGV